MSSDDTQSVPAGQPRRREVVSFTRRGGRLTQRQQRAWDELAPTFVIDVPRGSTTTSVAADYQFDAASQFGRDGRLVVEIGSGRGESLVFAAENDPTVNLLGLEVYAPGVAQTLVTMRHRGVSNIRMAVVDAVPALTTMLAPHSVDELRIWFPDPWHKVRHRKRRLVTPSFVNLAAGVLKPGATVRMATDWQDYADQMLDVLQSAEAFDFSGTWDQRFAGRPMTRFESKGVSARRNIRDLSAVRKLDI